MRKILSAICLLMLLILSVSCAGRAEKPADPTPDATPTALPTAEPAPPSDVTVKELLASLSASVWQNPLTCSEVPLLDASAVGIDREKYDTEWLYPYPETFDHTYLVTDYGVTPDENPQINSQKLNALFDELAGVSGTKHLIFPVGEYRFSQTLTPTGVSDLYIGSNEAGKSFDIVFTVWTHAFWATDCPNLHLRDFTLDYNPSSAIAGEIVSFSMAKSQIEVRINEEFDMSLPCYTGGIFESTHSYVEFTYDEVTGAYVPDANGNLKYDNDPVNGVTSLGYDPETRIMTLQVNNMKKPTVGNPVSIAFTEHQSFGIVGTRCSPMTMENLAIYHTGGMGIGMESCSALYMNRVRIALKEGSSRLMTCTADGFHPTDVQEITITNSAFTYTHDDALNVQSWYHQILGVAANTVSVRCERGNYAIEEGDEVEIFSTLDFHLVGTFKVTKILSDNGSLRKLKLSGMVDDGAGNQNLILADTTRGTHLIFRNNIVGNTRNRGIMMQCRDSVIENNAFVNIAAGTLCIYTIRDSASEGICPKNITVRNNKFFGSWGDICGYTYGTVGSSSYVMREITVYNNFFTKTAAQPIWVSEGFGDSEIHHNVFYDCHPEKPTKETAAIAVGNSKNIRVEDNTLYELSKRPGMKAYIGTNNENETVARNKKTILE